MTPKTYKIAENTQKVGLDNRESAKGEKKTLKNK